MSSCTESGAIEIVRGDDEDLVVTFLDSNDEAIDLTDSIVFFTVKNKDQLSGFNDDNAVIKKNILVHTDPTEGITTIPLTNKDTFNLDPDTEYWYDLQIKNPNGKISSTRKGKFVVLVDVTRRTSS